MTPRRHDATAPREVGDAVDALARRVLDAAFAVHRALGPGYAESVYASALAIECEALSIPFQREHPIQIAYRGTVVGIQRLDFLMDGQLIVELKSVEEFHPSHRAQVLSYLRATKLSLGLLLNFNVPVLKDGIRRIVLHPPSSKPPT